MLQIVFLVIAALGLSAALGTALSRNLVHAALYLIGFFFCVACMFVLLEAEFLAAVQVLVYIGAVAIILMFGIMLTRNTHGDEGEGLSGPWRLPAVAAGVSLCAMLVFGINNAVAPSGSSPWSRTTERPSLTPRPDEPSWTAERRQAVDDMARVIGAEFVTRYAMAFELAGLMLTAALVGAVALVHREERPTSAATDAEARPRTVAEPVGSSPS